MLLVEAGPENRLRFFCNTCPYVFGIDQKISKKAALERKQVDDILGDEVFENAQQTEAKCPECGHDRANFFQLQTRSADEPSSTFYRCMKCASKWKVD